MMKKMKLFIKMSFDVSKKYYILLIVSCFISGIQILLNLYLPALLVETITGDSGGIWGESVKYAMLIVVSNLALYLVTQVLDTRLEIEKIYVNDKMNQKLSQKIMTISYDKLENPQILDLRQRAVYAIQVQDAITNYIYIFTDVIKKIVLVTEVFWVLFSLSYFLVITILIFDTIMGIGYVLFKKYEKKCMDKLVSLNRRFSYYIGLCFDETLQKDIRLYNLSELMTDRVKEENRNILEHQNLYRKNRGLFYGMISTVNIIQSAISYSYIIFRTFGGKINTRLNYGQFTFYINAAIQAFTILKDLIFNMVNLSQILEYLEPYIEFMMIDNDEELYGSREADLSVVSLEFRNVSFTYPGTTEEVLKNVSFKISEKQKISIVGRNGAGKSTIVKLICRLYKPTSGAIYLNGIDIWNYNKESYYKVVTAVFQDYKMFATSILENISCGRECDYEDVRNWMEKLNIRYLEDDYSKGLDTELNKAYEDEGIDLSGGEKQKIAIARALCKGGNLFLLDEPTSSLDPKSEADIYSQFEKLTSGKMTIYISHRMSSSLLSDKILVLDEGSVIDYNTHSELMKDTEGIYYKLFMAQAQNYMD